MPVFGDDLACGGRTSVRGSRTDDAVGSWHLHEASISVIASDTVREIGRLSGKSPDVPRFRPNVVVRLLRSEPFQEDDWLGGALQFGEDDDAPRHYCHDARRPLLESKP